MSLRSIPAIVSLASAQLLFGTAALAGDAGLSGHIHVTQTDATLSAAIDDSVITTKVKAALLKPDNGVSGLEVEVSTHHGEVHLSGFVDSQNEVLTAERVALGIEGVKSVRNVIQIKGQQ